MFKIVRDVKDFIAFDGRYMDMHFMKEQTNKQIIEACRLEEYGLLKDSDIYEAVGGDYFITCLN